MRNFSVFILQRCWLFTLRKRASPTLAFLTSAPPYFRRQSSLRGISTIDLNNTSAMPAIKLTYKPDEGVDWDDGAALKSFQKLLEEGSSSTEETAQSIDALLPGPPSSSGSDPQYALYNLSIHSAKQITHDDPAMVKLIALMDRLSLSPKTAYQETANDGTQSNFRLHTLGWNLRDVFNPPFEPNKTPTDEELSGWLSLNTFMALLYSRNLIHGFDFSLWQMRSAFEQEVSGIEKEYEQGAAALWIIHAGPRLRQLVVDPPKLNEREERMFKAGEKFNGSPGWSQERWEFWTKGFEAAAEGEGACAKLCQRASEIIKAL